MSLEDDQAKADAAFVAQKARNETVVEILRQAESYLGAQMTTAIAADARAMAFVSLMAAATVVLAGGGVSLLTAAPPSPRLGWTAIGIAGAFLLSMACAIASAWPIRWSYSGTIPADWKDDVESGMDLPASLREQLVNYDGRIRRNARRMTIASRFMKAAVISAWFGLAIGGGFGIYFLSR